MHHEQILIEGLKEGNKRIFDYLFHLYYSGLVVYAIKYVENKDVAEDIVQDFFVKVWTSRASIQIDLSLKSYFFVSVRNRCFDWLRKHQLKIKTEQELQLRNQNTLVEASFLLESELQQQIQNAIDKLPPVCREIFVMNRFDGLKPMEIASLKNISVRTVETHIGKALRLLRCELEEYLPAALVAVLLNSLSLH